VVTEVVVKGIVEIRVVSSSSEPSELDDVKTEPAATWSVDELPEEQLLWLGRS
jgi:hypothetical protein